jgi:hypothetical protein
MYKSEGKNTFLMIFCWDISYFWGDFNGGTKKHRFLQQLFYLYSLKQINYECTSDFKNVCYPFLLLLF